MMPRVQVTNKLHEGRARASHSLHASLQTVDKPLCNGRGLAHARPTMLCIHLVYIMAGAHELCWVPVHGLLKMVLYSAKFSRHVIFAVFADSS